MLVKILVVHWWEWLSESPILFGFLGFQLGFQSPADTTLLTATSAWLAGWEKQSPVSAPPIHNNCYLPCSLGTSLHITPWWLRICFAFYFLSEDKTTEHRWSTCICLNSTFYNKPFCPPGGTAIFNKKWLMILFKGLLSYEGETYQHIRTRIMNINDCVRQTIIDDRISEIDFRIIKQAQEVIIDIVCACLIPRETGKTFLEFTVSSSDWGSRNKCHKCKLADYEVIQGYISTENLIVAKPSDYSSLAPSPGCDYT